jgi:hypothetical protein
MPYKSKFIPKNPKKYVGNPNNIICRSLWERTFCKYLDENANVIRWSSEELEIPYVSPIDKQIHRYYPDFLFEIKKGTTVETLVVEIKPKKQTKEPTRGEKSNRTYLTEMAQYQINTSKWESAKKFCDTNGWKFMILTENDLFKGKNN